MKWTDKLESDVYERLCNCCTEKTDILTLTLARWLWMKEQEKYKEFKKEDALIYVLELLDCNSLNYDLTEDETAEILSSIPF